MKLIWKFPGARENFLSYIFKYFTVTVYFKFCISSQFFDCGSYVGWFYGFFLLLLLFIRLLQTHRYLLLRRAVLLIPTMLLKQFLIKRELIPVTLKIAISIISLSYRSNLSLSVEISNTSKI